MNFLSGSTEPVDGDIRDKNAAHMQSNVWSDGDTSAHSGIFYGSFNSVGMLSNDGGKADLSLNLGSMPELPLRGSSRAVEPSKPGNKVVILG